MWGRPGHSAIWGAEQDKGLHGLDEGAAEHQLGLRGSRGSMFARTATLVLLDIAVHKNWESHIDASHSRQPLVKGERLVRYEVNAVIPRLACEVGTLWRSQDG